MSMKNLKKWLASIVTGLLAGVLFGIIFIVLGLNDTSSVEFTLETAFVTLMLIIIRYFWYDDGEDRCNEEEIIINTKKNYSELVSETITDQEDFDAFLDELNAKNREAWIKNKLGNKTEKNYPKYRKLRDKLERRVGFWVRPITITQVMTRSLREQVLSGKDYKKIRKAIQQALACFMSILWSILISLIAFKQLNLTVENLFRYLTYLFSMVWALLSSLYKGYRTCKKETIDHIARLTMIVNRYKTWKHTGDISNGSV